MSRDGAPTTQELAKLQVSINQIDYVLVPPGNLDNSTLPKVPVLRIFGTSSAGKKACVHIHQVYPYFFVEYKGDIEPRHVKRYISKLFCSLNHAIALSLKRNPHSSKSQFIRAILLVKGVHFYGFHSSYSPFLKILVVDPTYVTRIVTILQSGSVMNTRFTVYESHLSFVLQFLSDFGLYGCGKIELEEVLERCPEVAEEQGDPSSAEASSAMKFDPSPYFRESRLPLEVDAIAPHILNRRRLKARNWHHQLNMSAVDYQESEPSVPSVSELWEDERNHRKALGLNPSPEIPVDLSESSRAGGGEWVAEARWWEEIRKRIESDKPAAQPAMPNRTPEWEHSVMTTFESVEAIWEKQFRTWRPSKRENDLEASAKYDSDRQFSWDDNSSDQASDGIEYNVEVDISMLSDQDMVQLAEEEDYPNKETLLDPFQEENDHHVEEVDEDFGAGNDLALGEIVQDEELPDPFQDNNGDEARTPTQTEAYRLQSPPTPSAREGQDRGSPTPTKELEGIPPVINCDPVLDLTTTESNTVEMHTPRGESLVDDAPEIITERHTQDPQVEAAEALRESQSLKNRSLVTARAVQLSHAFESCKAINSNQFMYSVTAPTPSYIKGSFEVFGLPSKVYQPPYYSKDNDVPDAPKEYAGLVYRLKGGTGIATLEEWSTPLVSGLMKASPATFLDSAGVGGWEYAGDPPSVKEVRRFLRKERASKGRSLAFRAKLTSQIEGPTQFNVYGFKTAPVQNASATRESANLSVLSVEIFVPTHDNKVPDPETDEITALTYAFQVTEADSIHTGALVLQNPALHKERLRHIRLQTFPTELELLNCLADLVNDFDPDILTGWELQLQSWGYIQARSKTYGLDFADLVSRAPSGNTRPTDDQWSFRKTSTFKVAGRHVLNLWRIMRSERPLSIYSFENVVFEVLRKRVPKYSYQAMTELFESSTPGHTSAMLSHLSMRATTNLELLDETETITKTAEFARVFGVDFFSVLSRGSQFKVESFMFRIAKPESFVLISPSKSDVGKQNAAECMPLIMEPASAFYSSPLLVLDFQSLYPSIMIAYNYCYSTCLGRVSTFKGTYKFGVVNDLDISSALLEKLQGNINVAPNGIMYVKQNVRKGLLGRMLTELLDTRVMVKQAMKRVGNDKARKRVLDARQLSLKYIANVTYGYTSASFSGRMPAVEIADSIVQSGRETLEKTIDVIDSTSKWGAKVVYGDTDSVFVYLPGKTKEEAFAIGAEIADTITAMNPAPIKLKFEKVYHPCVLLAKKRYVGFKYENIDDAEPVFDAKGIETVRRDGVLAQRKMVEHCLKTLFRTQDLSEVKDYCCRSWTKLLENKAPVHDFIFAKEVKMGTYNDKGPPPPGVLVAARKMVNEPHAEAQYGDRIPYVIVRSSESGVRLVDRAMDPLEFMNDDQLQLDALYYITRVLIPPLERIFNLVGADIKQWFNEMPKSSQIAELVSPKKPKPGTPARSPEKPNIDLHFLHVRCLSCGGPSPSYVCYTCLISPQESITRLGFQIKKKEKRLKDSHLICSTCTGLSPADPILCESLDCPWFYARRKAEAEMEMVPLYVELSEELEREIEHEDEEGREVGDYVDWEVDLEYESEPPSEYDHMEE
ncbi:hypothetical protein CPC08DRAFT_402859 [Agrocybe pediades]|nr:hypothetical protein CPC08DRAFT_402859 [Agrocybe pediades]